MLGAGTLVNEDYDQVYVTIFGARRRSSLAASFDGDPVHGPATDVPWN